MCFVTLQSNVVLEIFDRFQAFWPPYFWITCHYVIFAVVLFLEVEFLKYYYTISEYTRNSPFKAKGNFTIARNLTQFGLFYFCLYKDHDDLTRNILQAFLAKDTYICYVCQNICGILVSRRVSRNSQVL